MAKDSNPFGDVTAMIERFKLPGIDMSALVDARRKDIDALVEANRAAYEAMQALATKQSDMLTQAMQGIQESVKSAGGGAMADPAKQAALAGQAWQKTLGDMKDMADMARKAQSDVMASITQRAAQNMQDIKNLMQVK